MVIDYNKTQILDVTWRVIDRRYLLGYSYIMSLLKLQILFIDYKIIWMFNCENYLTKTFQKDNLLSSAQQMYGSRECQLKPPNSLSEATNSGSSVFSDFRCVTTRETFGRPMLATTCWAFGEYFMAKPPSSCNVFVSIARLQKWRENIFWGNQFSIGFKWISSSELTMDTLDHRH